MIPLNHSKLKHAINKRTKLRHKNEKACLFNNKDQIFSVSLQNLHLNIDAYYLCNFSDITTYFHTVELHINVALAQYNSSKIE